jgi:flagellar motor switch protein FliM
LKICRFEEYINTLFIPTSINVVKMSPLKGAALFVADAKLVFALVENYFGGEGKVHYNKEASEFTLIEQRIVKMMLDFFFKDLKEAWSSLLDVQFEYKAMEVNPAIANIMNLSDLIIVSRFRFELEGGGGDFQICLPYSMIEPIQELLSAGIKIEKQESDDEWLKHIREEVLKVDIDINCVLTQKKITLKDVMRFKNGDVINIEIPEEITLKVNEIPMFTANFGTFEGKYSVKIVDKIKKTEKR